jgi:hypothetical protein
MEFDKKFVNTNEGKIVAEEKHVKLKSMAGHDEYLNHVEETAEPEANKEEKVVFQYYLKWITKKNILKKIWKNLV